MKISYNKPLFLKKLITLFCATLVLAPFIYFKLYIPAAIYLIVILVLHGIFLGAYLVRIPWKVLLSDKRVFFLRLLGIAMFGYLLVLLKFNGKPWFVLANILLAFMVHAIILTLLMVRVL